MPTPAQAALCSRVGLAKKTKSPTRAASELNLLDMLYTCWRCVVQLKDCPPSSSLRIGLLVLFEDMVMCRLTYRFVRLNHVLHFCGASWKTSLHIVDFCQSSLSFSRHFKITFSHQTQFLISPKRLSQ